jgi:type VI secretion system protein ImpK
MREEIANLVHPVFTYGLNLRDRLEQGETPDLGGEQAALKGLLLSDYEARRWADFGGEGAPDQSVGGGISGMADGSRRGSDHFLGIRYALACWLDELFTLGSSWGAEWTEQRMEWALYRSNDRAWKFWDQARRAEARPGTDALEVFFLCVMLGFRGDLRDEPDKLRAWAGSTQARIARGQGQEWPVPPERGDPPTHVPPRHARERLQRVVLTGGVLLLGVIFAVAFVVVRQLSG